MAEIIEDFTPTRGRPPKYPWGQWADGRAWRIKRGEDFTIELADMASVLRSHAARKGLSVTHLIDSEAGAISFRFTAPTTRRRKAA